MLDITIGSFNQYLKSFFNSFGINFDIVYSNEFDRNYLFGENFSFKSFFKANGDIKSLADLKYKFSNTKDYGVLLYNFNPPTRTKDAYNNQPYYVMGNKPIKKAVKGWKTKWYPSDGKSNVEPFIGKEKELENTNQNSFDLRKFHQVDMLLNYKFITPSTSLLSEFLNLYVIHLQDNLKVNLEIDFGGSIGKDNWGIKPKFEDIEEMGLISIEDVGDLKQISFNVNLNFTLISNFSSVITGVKEVVISIGV